MSKRIQISPDVGTTWYTFPGDKGDYGIDGNDIKDTIFGSDYESGQTGLLNWHQSCNGMFKGFAGYVTKISKSGTPTTFTTLPFTLVSGKTFRITDVTKNVWDRTTTVNFFDNGVAVIPAEVLSIDYLNGVVTFTAGHTVVGPITATGKFLPLSQVAGANGFTLSQTANAVDNTDYVVAQTNTGYRDYIYGLKTIKLNLKGFYKVSNAFEALVAARTEMIVEINLDGTGLTVARGWFKPLMTSHSGNVGALEDMALDFVLSVPDQANISLPFKWTFSAGSTLNLALQTALNNWATGTTLATVNYLADGINGYKGLAVITDISLSGGLDVMNDFTLKFQGSDVPVIFP